MLPEQCIYGFRIRMILWKRLRPAFLFIRRLIWFPYKTPSLSSFKGCLLDFEHLGLRGSEHGYSLDSVPVGAPQNGGHVGEPSPLAAKNKDINATANVPLDRWMCKGRTGRKRKMTTRLTAWCSVRRPIPEVAFTSSAMEQTRAVFRSAEPVRTVQSIRIMC